MLGRDVAAFLVRMMAGDVACLTSSFRKPSKDPHHAAKLSRKSLSLVAKTFACVLALCAPPLLIWYSRRSVRLLPLAHGISINLLSGGSRAAQGVNEPVDCSFNHAGSARLIGSNMVMLTSNGLSNDMLKDAFLDLVRRLPFKHTGGPEAFSNLNVMVIEDPCLLKKSFWNKDAPEFHQEGIINYVKSGMWTRVELVEPFFGGKMDGGSCVDWKSQKSGLIGLGFNASRFHHVSLFDRLAQDGLKRAVFQLGTTGDAPQYALEGTADADSREGQAFLALLRRTSVVIVNGGNPDFVNYVFHRFAADLMRPLRRRMTDGAMVLVGRSAGSMVASADLGMTYETGPAILNRLLHSTSAAMALTGTCMVRPHFTEKWYIASMVYATKKNLTAVLLYDGQALSCAVGECRIVGERRRLPEPHFNGQRDPRLIRMADAFR